MTDELEKEENQVRKFSLLVHHRRVPVQVMEELTLKYGRRRDLVRLFVVGGEVIGVIADFRLPAFEKLCYDERTMLARSHRSDGPFAKGVHDGLVVGSKLERVVTAAARDLKASLSCWRKINVYADFWG